MDGIGACLLGSRESEDEGPTQPQYLGLRRHSDVKVIGGILKGEGPWPSSFNHLQPYQHVMQTLLQGSK